MTDDYKMQLQLQFCNIANTLRGKMGADEFRDFILGFIFHKYLSERMHMVADEILKNDGIAFDQIDEATVTGKEKLELSTAVKVVVEDKVKYADWSQLNDIKTELKVGLILVLAEYNYLRSTVMKSIGISLSSWKILRSFRIHSQLN